MSSAAIGALDPGLGLELRRAAEVVLIGRSPPADAVRRDHALGDVWRKPLFEPTFCPSSGRAAVMHAANGNGPRTKKQAFKGGIAGFSAGAHREAEKSATPRSAPSTAYGSLERFLGWLFFSFRVDDFLPIMRPACQTQRMRCLMRSEIARDTPRRPQEKAWP